MADTITNFSFFVPATVTKGGADGNDRLIAGIASTNDLDLQGERVVQSGIDVSYFLKHGWINDDHKPGVENKVGEPIEAKITKDGLWIKASLLKGKERADYWWEHITSLQQSGSKRKVGFSIQGKVQRREGNSITKCWLQDVAITASPVNTKTWGDVVKSLSAQDWCDPDTNKSCKECGTAQPCDSHRELEEKALTTSSGAALIPQSLEGKQKDNVVFKSAPDVMTYEEAVMAVQKEKGLSKSVARAIVDSIFYLNGITV